MFHDAEKPFRVAASPEAEHVLDDYQHSTYERRSELADVKLFAVRWNENAWRVALTLHAAFYRGEAHLQPLGGETAENAVRVVQWFASQQLEILAKGRRRVAAKLEEEVWDLLTDRSQGRRLEPEERQLGRAVDYITARNVQRARIAPGETAHAVLARMEADGRLVGEDIPALHGGKTKRVYRAVKNPVPG
jgi:hypothetical protein